MDLTVFDTFVFDCDGVILNSNHVKTEAFFNSALDYGLSAAEQLRDYHVKNGGVSRYIKYRYFLETIVGKGFEEQEYQSLLKKFSQEVIKGLECCELATGLKELREQTESANWLVVSGGDQSELRQVFRKRCINTCFDGGIFGSPDDKESILKREIARGNIKRKALFIGDSKYDYKASQKAGLEFLFLSSWTEVGEWERWVDDNRINHLSSISEIAEDVDAA